MFHIVLAPRNSRKDYEVIQGRFYISLPPFSAAIWSDKLFSRFIPRKSNKSRVQPEYLCFVMFHTALSDAIDENSESGFCWIAMKRLAHQTRDTSQ